MTDSISTRIQKALIGVLLVVAAFFVAIAIPHQINMSRNSAELIRFSLDVIAKRDNNNLANELFENRTAAIRLHLEDILKVHNVLSVSVYDVNGKLVELATTTSHPPDALTPLEMDQLDSVFMEGESGYTFIKPIRAVGETFGWIRIVYDISNMKHETTIYYLSFGCFLLLSLGSIFFLLRWRLKPLIIAPIKTLAAAMQTAKASGISTPVQSQNLASELASLFDTYNEMSTRLRETYNELDKKKGQLEGALKETAKQAEALTESEARYRAIVTQAPVGILIFNNDGIVVDANDYLAVIMGAPSPDKIKGIDMLNDIKDKGVVERVQEAITSNTAFYENYYTSLSGKKTVYIRTRLLRINSDLLCGVFEDLTQHKDMLKALSESESNLAVLNRDLEDKVQRRTQALTDQKDRLEEANARLQELDKLKTAFLSSVSHELRTPLTSILGFTKITLKQFKKHIAPLVDSNPDVIDKSNNIEENLTIVTHEGERLSRLVNDFLDLARIESDKMPWNDTEVNPSEVLQNVISASAGDFHQTDVALKADIPTDLPSINIDPDKMFQVIRNLLHNAAKFTELGSVTVKAAHLVEEDEIEICVEDTGPGIKESDINSVFDRFHQVNESEDGTDKPKGSGLGLAICKQIVEHYQGRIWVESGDRAGSKFIVRLPLP